MITKITPYSISSKSGTSNSSTTPQYASTLTFKGSETPHRAPKGSWLSRAKGFIRNAALALGLASAPAVLLTGCPSGVEVDPNEHPPVKVVDPPPTATATATSTSTVLTDKTASNLYLGKLQAAGLIPGNVETIDEGLESAWHDTNNIADIKKTVASNTESVVVLNGETTHVGGKITKFNETITGNDDGSTTLVKTVNGNETARYRITNQTRTLKNGTTRTFADFECLSGDCFNQSWSGGDGTGKVGIYTDGNFEIPSNTLTKYTVKPTRQSEPIFVQRLIKAGRDLFADRVRIFDNAPTLANDTFKSFYRAV